MNKKNICFIGYGKMIQGIIDKLSPEKYHFAVTSLCDKQNLFKNTKINYERFDILSDSPPVGILENSDIICFNLPPVDLECFTHFINFIPKHVQFIFTSSISVYQKNQGVIDESGTLLDPRDNKLIALENIVMEKMKNYVILRLGGLYGPSRHPIYSLNGKTDLLGQGELIHLLHHDDAQSAIIKIIDQNINHEIFNIISDSRLSKKEYYDLIATRLNLKGPLYKDSDKSSSPNNISNEKSKKLLSLTYQDPTHYQGKIHD